MTSVQSAYSQRNRNSEQLLPVYNGILPEIGPPVDLSGAAYYTLRLPKVQYTGGSFYVDLAAPDISGNPLNFDGQLKAGGNSIRVINFIVDVPKPASTVTNMEFTIFFKNIPDIGPLTIGLVSPNGIPAPYILSAPAPTLMAPSINPSITFKSDGTDYTVVSSGPAGWMGIYLLSLLVSSLSI